jgi:uncharacterized protein
MHINTVEQLRALYPAATGRSLKKQLSTLDQHCQKFIKTSPFVVIASSNQDHSMDASPRGGKPGFIKAINDKTLLIPDSPGNNRLDTLENILSVGHVGLIFFIPGVDETLRVNGSAQLSVKHEYLQLFANENRPPKLVIEVSVAEAYLHCAKAFMRSSLWDPSARVDRAVLPTMGQMLHSQTGIAGVVETQEEMVARYAADL